MAEYINRKILVDLVLSKLKFMGDARIMNQNDKKVLSEIDGYEKAINAVHELILDKDLIENIQPVKHGKWLNTRDKNKKMCSCCGVIHFIAQYPFGRANHCPNCGAKIDDENEEGQK